MAAADGAIELEGVAFAHEDWEMAATLGVPSGECLALIGPSGAGKSTILNLIAGFAAPRRGRVLIGGRDVTGLPPDRRPVTTVFQEHNLFAHLTAAQNVGLGLHPGLRLDRAGWAAVEAALAATGLEGLGPRLPEQLSGGQRQRVAIARALVRRRPVLLLDEPFSALGPALRREMLGLVTALREAHGLTVVLVSHDPADALAAAGRAAFVHAGQVLAEGPTAALLGRRDLPELAAYLGEAAL
ncbi:MAG TPA: thiamine ABC transporter ATP-binding protein [Alphaproteobacteria bacterium]|nr:thiamine ABC transporter ATP-binding protein [Alphaproteobacteria bacterium]